MNSSGIKMDNDIIHHNSIACNEINISYPSQCSSISNDSDLSFSISNNAGNKEIANHLNNTNSNHDDELPAFEIRLIAPLSRSPSPIDMDLDSCSSSSAIHNLEQESSAFYYKHHHKQQQQQHHHQHSHEDYISLKDINSQISPPKDGSDACVKQDELKQIEEETNAISNLETIYEGIYLHTPPRQRRSISLAQINNGGNGTSVATSVTTPTTTTAKLEKKVLNRIRKSNSHKNNNNIENSICPQNKSPRSCSISYQI